MDYPLKPLMTPICVALLAACAAKTPEGSYVRNDDGIVVTPAAGDAKRVRLEVRSDRIVRVSAVPGEHLDLPKSLMVVDASTPTPEFEVEEDPGEVVLSTSRLVAHVSLTSGAVRFTDPAGHAMLAETAQRVLGPGVSLRFNPSTDEAFYGLGQHQNAQMNLNGEDVELAQHNMDIGVPFVVSSRRAGDAGPKRHGRTEAADDIRRSAAAHSEARSDELGAATQARLWH
jgi:alpha-D-xyloside xylohydrolase